MLTISKPYVAAAYRQKLRLLQARGFTAGLICPPSWSGQAFEPAPSDQEYFCAQVPVVWNGKNHFHFYGPGLAAAVREFAPDILNIEEEHYSIVTWQCLRLARARAIPALFYTWQNIYKRYPPPFSWIETQVFRTAAAAVTGNSEATAVLRRKGYTGMVAEIPQMGVNMDLFMLNDATGAAHGNGNPSLLKLRRDELGLTAKGFGTGFGVGFVGRLVAEKGVDLLLRAAAQLAKNGQPIWVLILGNGPCRAELGVLAQELGINDRVAFIEQVPSALVANYLQALDALCLPSLTRPNWKEQFGRVLVEAMAAGAVVVGSDSGEIPHVIGDSGVVFREGDVAHLTAVLGQVIADPKLAAQLRQKASARVKAHYTNDVIADRYAALFHTLLAAPH